MIMKKSLLAAGMLAGLYSTTVFAQVNIADGDPSNAIKLASELIVPSSGLTLTGTAFNIVTQQGFNMSAGEVRYARLECDSNVKFKTATISAKSNANAAVGAINGIGTSAISFSVTANGAALASADTFTIDGDRTLTTMGNADCYFSLYDQPSQASTGGTTGRINLISDRYITPTSAIDWSVYRGPFTHTATVNAVPAFSQFKSPFANLGSDATHAQMAVSLATASAAVDDTGAAVATNSIIGPSSTVFLDLTGASIGPGTFYSTPTYAKCLAGSGDPANTKMSATNEFPATLWATSRGICYEVPAGNTAPIPVMSPMLTLKVVPADPKYRGGNYGPIDGGKIIHDGTTLQASLVQRPDGWLSRIVLVNNGTQARNYAFRVVGEAGNTITTTAANMTGSIPANSQKVIDVNSLLAGFSAAPRSAILVDIAAPSTEVEGLYQIVNPDTGGIDNSQMVRAGNP